MVSSSFMLVFQFIERWLEIAKTLSARCFLGVRQMMSRFEFFSLLYDVREFALHCCRIQNACVVLCFEDPTTCCVVREIENALIVHYTIEPSYYSISISRVVVFGYDGSYLITTIPQSEHQPLQR